MFRWKDKSGYSRYYRPVLFCSAAALGLALIPVSAKAATVSKTNFCSKLGKSLGGSQGAYMYCFGAQPNGTAAPQGTSTTSTGLANVDAASRTEDRTNSGAYIGGQSETSIAASGNYVVEAWNDGTGFFAGCGSSHYKEELTGFGFSTNGGASFADLGGLPNSDCNNSRWEGDPSVGVYTTGGSTYFYVTSLFSCSFLTTCAPYGGLAVGLSACKVTGSTLSCGQPIVVATGNCHGVQNTNTTFCSPFLDKDYLTVDQARKKLYVSFTDFTVTYDGTVEIEYDNIDLGACDLDNPMAPVCSNGASFGRPYLTVQSSVAFEYNSQTGASVSGCEIEGAYPAVRTSTGDVYVGYEYNWVTNFVGAPVCVNNRPTLEVLKHVPHSCLPDPDTGTSTCAPTFSSNSNSIVSTDATVVPGYNRGQMNDFPRIAVSEQYGTVSLVWNDARNAPLGDILLQSYELDTLDHVQGSPVRLNSDDSFEDAHLMPGLRNTSSDGLLNVTWYDRRGANAGTGKTDVYGALNVNPKTSGSPTSNTKITNESTDWTATSSVIVPNFGDYTDNYVSSSNTLFVAWSDGRSGVPQPYEAHVGVH